MATRPAVRSRRIERNKLATFLKSHELIRAFEAIADDVANVLPDAVLVTETTLDEARAVAQDASSVANNARAAADRLAEALSALNATLQTQRSERTAINNLQRRCDELEAQLAAVQRAPAIEDLRRQIAELQTLVIGA